MGINRPKIPNRENGNSRYAASPEVATRRAQSSDALRQIAGRNQRYRSKGGGPKNEKRQGAITAIHPENINGYTSSDRGDGKLKYAKKRKG